MTTKKAEKAAQVAAAKREAYVTKVRTMLGHVGRRMPLTEINAAFDAGTDALVIASEIASREPVGRAVHARKVDAIVSANERAQKAIANVAAKLEAAGWDINAAAPYDRRASCWDTRNELAKKLHNFYAMLTKRAPGYPEPKYFDSTSPKIVMMCEEAAARFIKNAETDAATQYDAFICKLVSKVGECTDATLEGNHIWGESYLTVTTATGETQVWKTHQIWNVSKLGNEFPQWPTRLMKR